MTVQPFDSLIGVSARIRAGETRSEEVTQGLLDRIARYDGQLCSSALVLADSALAEARAADAEIAAGRWRGPLHGVPLGVKDLLWTAGLPTMAGMDVLRDFRPQADATVVARLREAGAVLIAKHQMTEGATLTHHPAFARPLNPWNRDHWTGVSSSGSAVAVAAGLSFGSIGSDTGGSIRMPCSANNLTGIKPTWGRVSRHGLVHLCESLDHLGPMARSAMDAAAILQAIAGPDPHDPTSLPDPVPDYLAQAELGVRGMRLGIDRRFAAGDVDPQVVAALEQALEAFGGLGMDVRDIEFPWSPAEAGFARPIFEAEIALAHAKHWPARADRYGPWLRYTLENIAAISGIDVARAHVLRDRFRGRLRALFHEVDFVLLPGIGTLPPSLERMAAMERGAEEFDEALVRFTSPFNVSGAPTISLPAGFSRGGLPIGIQLGGPWLSEAALIRTGVAFQRETGYHLRHPDLAGFAAD